MSDKKYISFDTWWGGYSNIRKSYEIAACIAYITDRILILPPKTYCHHLSEWQDKTSWFDIFSTMNKDALTSKIDQKNPPLSKI